LGLLLVNLGRSMGKTGGAGKAKRARFKRKARQNSVLVLFFLYYFQDLT